MISRFKKLLKGQSHRQYILYGLGAAMLMAAAFVFGMAASILFATEPSEDLAQEAPQAYAASAETSYEAQPQPSLPPAEIEKTSLEPEGFIIGEQGGFVAVFAETAYGIKLEELTRVPIARYPEEEQLRLQEGIRIVGRTAMLKALQSYD